MNTNALLAVNADGFALPATPKRWSSLENPYGIISSTQCPISNMSSVSLLCSLSTLIMTGPAYKAMPLCL